MGQGEVEASRQPRIHGVLSEVVLWTLILPVVPLILGGCDSSSKNSAAPAAPPAQSSADAMPREPAKAAEYLKAKANSADPRVREEALGQIEYYSSAVAGAMDPDVAALAGQDQIAAMIPSLLESPYPDVRKWAAILVQTRGYRLDERKTTEALLRTMGDPAAQDWACFGIQGKKLTPEDVPALLRGLTQGPEKGREQIADLMVALGSPCVKSLTDLLTHADLGIRLVAARSLVRIGEHAPAFEEIARQGVSSENALHRFQAVKLLVDLRVDPDFVLPLSIRAAKENPRGEFIFLDALTAYLPKPPGSWFEHLLDHPDVEVRQRILSRIFSNHGDELSNSERLYLLVRVCGDVSAKIRSDGAVGINNVILLGGHALWNALEGQDAEERARLDPFRAGAEWVALEGGGPALDAYLGRGVAQYTDAIDLQRAEEAASDQVDSLLRGLQSEDAQRRTRAARCIGRIPADAHRSVPALCLATEDAVAAVQCSAAAALGRLGHRARNAVASLEKLLTNPSAEVRREAEEALKRIRGK